MCAVDFVVARQPREGSLLEAYDVYRSRADAQVVCDYGLHVAVTSWSDKIAAEMGSSAVFPPILT